MLLSLGLVVAGVAGAVGLVAWLLARVPHRRAIEAGLRRAGGEPARLLALPGRVLSAADLLLLARAALASTGGTPSARARYARACCARAGRIDPGPATAEAHARANVDVGELDDEAGHFAMAAALYRTAARAASSRPEAERLHALGRAAAEEARWRERRDAVTTYTGP